MQEKKRVTNKRHHEATDEEDFHGDKGNTLEALSIAIL
jgi:hypothetical protein